MKSAMSLVARVLRALLPRPRGRPRQPFDEPKRSGKRNNGEPDQGGVPVEPNRPNTLSGGAAAALEFDD
jgi:hypothetical protein